MAERLTTIRDNLLAQLADLSANPKPNYSIDGQSVSWSDHMQSLLSSLKNINEQLDRQDGPVEEISILVE